jgi:RNA polymerase sigma-70 factor (ECF subfamily)
VTQVVEGEFATTIVEAQAGSLPALASLYRRHQPSVLAYLRRRAPGEADDLSSDVWLDVQRGLNRFSGDEGGFRRWVFTIARRRLIDDRRRTRRRSTEPSGDLDLCRADHDPAEEAVAAVLAAEVRRNVERLPTEQAAVVRLRLVDGLSVDETAVRLGKRPGAVRALQHRGIRRLASLAASAVFVAALTVTLGVADALPAPVQRAVHEVLDRIGLRVVPDPDAPTDNGDGAGAEPEREELPTAGAARLSTSKARGDTPRARAEVPRTNAGTARSAGAPSEPATGTATATPPVVDASGDEAPPPGQPADSPGTDPAGSQDPPASAGGGPPATPPGLDAPPPGQGGSPPGLGGPPPGQGGTPPGQGGTPPGQAR